MDNIISICILLVAMVDLSIQQNFQSGLSMGANPGLLGLGPNLLTSSNSLKQGQMAAVGASSSTGQAFGLGPGAVASIQNQAQMTAANGNAQGNGLSQGSASGFGATAGGTTNVGASLSRGTLGQSNLANMMMMPGGFQSSQGSNSQKQASTSGNAGAMGAALTQGNGIVSSQQSANMVATNGNVQDNSVSANTAVGFGSKTVGSANAAGNLQASIGLNTNFGNNQAGLLIPGFGSSQNSNLMKSNQATGNAGSTGTASAQGPNSASSEFNSANVQNSPGMTSSNSLNSGIAMGRNAAASGSAQAGGTLNKQTSASNNQGAVF